MQNDVLTHLHELFLGERALPVLHQAVQIVDVLDFQPDEGDIPGKVLVSRHELPEGFGLCPTGPTRGRAHGTTHDGQQRLEDNFLSLHNIGGVAGVYHPEVVPGQLPIERDHLCCVILRLLRLVRPYGWVRSTAQTDKGWILESLPYNLALEIGGTHALVDIGHHHVDKWVYHLWGDIRLQATGAV